MLWRQATNFICHLPQNFVRNPGRICLLGFPVGELLHLNRTIEALQRGR